MKAAEKKTGLFERLKRGLEEGIQFAKGELPLRTTKVVARRKKTSKLPLPKKKRRAS